MRVFHVVATDQLRGAEIFARDLITALARRGVDQHVAVLREGPNSHLDFGIPTTTLSAKPSPANLRAVRRLRGVVRSWSPDLIQAHGGEAMRACVLASGRGVPIAYRRIGLSPARLQKGLRRLGYRLLVRRTAAVVSVASSVRQDTIDVFGVNPERATMIPNAADPIRLRSTLRSEETARDLGLPRGTKLVVWIGALVEEKDPLRAVEVAQMLAGIAQDWTLALIGDGPLRGAVREAARNGGVDDRMRFLGERTDVENVLGLAELLLVTSTSEGMPASVIEAGMLALPVVAFAVGGIPEVVVPNETGLLFPPGELSSLTTGVAQLLGDESRRKAMGKAAQGRCLELFHIDGIANQYLDLYETVIARTR